MKYNQTLNTNDAIAKPEDLAFFRQKCLQNSKLKEFYISQEDEEAWMTFRNKISQKLINNNQSQKK